MIVEIRTPAEYKTEMFKDVPMNTAITDSHKEAIKHALDIRKFEIELYWKRATYFWTFIGASFVAYFALISSVNYLSLKKHIVLVSVIGFIFSYFWYFVNRGSKFWQDNWERHVDYLEDSSIGSLYKIVLNPNNSNFKNLLSEYPISVTKINQLLSLIISGIWLFMLNRAIKQAFNLHWIFNILVCLLGLIAVTIVLYHLCQSRTTKDKIDSDAKFIKRGI